MHQCCALFLELRRAPVMQGHATMLLLQEEARIAPGKRTQLTEDRRRQRRLSARNGVAGVQPEFRPMGAGRGEPRRRKNSIDVGDRSAADQRQRPTQPRGQARQQFDEGICRVHLLGVILDIEQSSVDIEKEREIRGLEVVGRRRHGVTLPCGSPLVASGGVMMRVLAPSRHSVRNCKMLKFRSLTICLPCLLLVACAPAQPVIDEQMMRIDGEMPADLSGSWERDYSRGDDVNQVLRDIYYYLSRTSADRAYIARPGPVQPSSKDFESIRALARLAELITRPQVLTISQNDQEITVDRKDDFSLLCAFYDGVASGTESDYGTEICGWDGDELVSHLVLPDGLQVTHRFTVSEDRQQLRIVTTVSSSAARVPVTLSRFYKKFERLPPDFNCIETLSMKRVCSTGEIVL
jgi:hypothetical protein